MLLPWLVAQEIFNTIGGLPKFRLEQLNGRIAPKAVVPGRLRCNFECRRSLKFGGSSSDPILPGLSKPKA